MKEKTIAKIMAAALAAAGLGLMLDCSEGAVDVFTLKKIAGAALMAMAPRLCRMADAAGKEGEA